MNIEDELSVIQLLNRYGIAIDTRRFDLFDTIFTEDAQLEYPSRSWHDLATFKADFAEQHAVHDATQHMMANHLVEGSGDRASAVTYCSWRLIRRGAVGGDTVEGTAWYDDDLVRTDRGWRIERRRCRILWTEGNPGATGSGSGPGCTSMRDDAAAGRIAYLRAIDDAPA